MNIIHEHLELLLRAAALAQLGVALLNLTLIRIMNWEPDLARAPLLIREVFHIHVHFISITLAIFGVLTWRFAGEIAAGVDPLHRWLACAIGLFWAVRAVLQVAYYSSSHWRGIPARTTVHIILLSVYSSWAAIYLVAGLRR